MAGNGNGGEYGPPGNGGGGGEWYPPEGGNGGGGGAPPPVGNIPTGNDYLQFSKQYYPTALNLPLSMQINMLNKARDRVICDFGINYSIRQYNVEAEQESVGIDEYYTLFKVAYELDSITYDLVRISGRKMPLYDSITAIPSYYYTSNLAIYLYPKPSNSGKLHVTAAWGTAIQYSLETLDHQDTEIMPRLSDAVACLIAHNMAIYDQQAEYANYLLTNYQRMLSLARR